MPHIFFAAFSNRDDALAIADDAVRELHRRGTSSSIAQLDDSDFQPTSHDLIVSLGGDGTFLRAARIAHAANARVLPVNLGRMGFLLDVPIDQLIERVESAVTSSKESLRLALDIDVLNDEPIHAFALNEVVVERARSGQMVRVRTLVDGEEYLTYSADGVMVATPMGSTGYNFSAGGPVVDPQLDVMILTPIAPHFTIDRSIVVPASSAVLLESVDKPSMLVADGRPVAELSANQVVRVTKNRSPVRVVYSDSFSIGRRLRQGLREGHA